MIENLKEEFAILEDKDMENKLFERFGEYYLEDAIRIISSGNLTSLDGPLVNEALCIIVAMYTNKVRNGEINKDKVVH